MCWRGGKGRFAIFQVHSRVSGRRETLFELHVGYEAIMMDRQGTFEKCFKFNVPIENTLWRYYFWEKLGENRGIAY